MPRLVQVFWAKAHRQQILESDDLDIWLIELLAILILDLPVRLLSIVLTPLAPDHENAGIEAAELSYDLSTDAAWTAATFQVTCYCDCDNITSLDLAC